MPNGLLSSETKPVTYVEHPIKLLMMQSSFPIDYLLQPIYTNQNNFSICVKPVQYIQSNQTSFLPPFILLVYFQQFLYDLQKLYFKCKLLQKRHFNPQQKLISVKYQFRIAQKAKIKSTSKRRTKDFNARQIKIMQHFKKFSLNVRLFLQ